MIDCQLQPNGIIEPAVIEAVAHTPRERFLPDDLRHLAYIDDHFMLPGGEVMLSPVTQARLIQAAGLTPSDVVLNVMDASGYATAVAARLSSMVVALEGRPGQLDLARKEWALSDCCNIAIVGGAAHEGDPRHAPYSAIIVNGALCADPDNLFSQLAPSGRLVYIAQGASAPVGQICLVKKSASGGALSRVRLQDVSVPVTAGEAKAEKRFAF